LWRKWEGREVGWNDRGSLICWRKKEINICGEKEESWKN
jgi:hypothetical protein